MSKFSTLQNTEAVLVKLLRDLKINIPSEKIIDELYIHPEYPGLLAISDVLRSFKVENAAYRITPNDLTEVPVPFLAETKLSDGNFVLVHQIANNHFILSDHKWNRYKLKLDEFKKIFKSVVLTVEPLESFANTNSFLTTFSSLKLPIVTAATLLIVTVELFSAGYFKNLNWQILMLTIFKTGGLVTSVLLLIQSIDSNNPLVQKLCRGGGKTNCNAILSSKASKVFEGLSWSEVGFFYFAGTWLLLMFGGHSSTIWLALFFLNVISLPYTVYSINYQVRVAKQWCILCCVVQALLWMEFISLINFKRDWLIIINWAGISTILMCLVSPVILWVLLKPLLLKAQQLKPLKQQLRKFKFNTEQFNNMLAEQPKYVMPDKEWSIVLGNVAANNIITMVSNPYCPPCAKMHRALHELLEQRADIQARIVFTAVNTDDDIKTPVSRHMMSLNNLTDKNIVKRALYDWYEQKQKNYEAWAKTYPVETNVVEHHKIDDQKAWCEMAEITATPTMLLNGYRLPDLYQLQDLKYMLQ